MKRINREDPFWIQAFCAAITGFTSRDNVGTQLNQYNIVNRAIETADFAVERIAAVNKIDDEKSSLTTAPPSVEA
jgi:hypothetical protein